MEKLIKEINDNIAELTANIDRVEESFEEDTRPYRDQKGQHSAFQEKYGSKSYYFYMKLFEGKSKLYIPSSQRDYGLRPRMEIDYNSSGIRVLKDGMPITQLNSTDGYKIQCQVHNGGDLLVPLANVEFFVAPVYKPNDLDIEVNSARVERRPVRREGRTEVLVSLEGEVKRGSLSSLDYINVICKGQVVNVKAYNLEVKKDEGSYEVNSVNEGDLIRLEMQVPVTLAEYLIEGYRVIAADPIANQNTNAFRLAIEDVFTITGRGAVVTGIADQGSVAVGDSVFLVRDGVRMAKHTVTGIEKFRKMVETGSSGEAIGILLRGVSREAFKTGDVLIKEASSVARVVTLPKPDSLQDFAYLGKSVIDVPALDSAVAEFSFNASQWKGKGAVFACRAFSLMPIDMPDNFDSLDAKTNRYVGVLEVK